MLAVQARLDFFVSDGIDLLTILRGFVLRACPVMPNAVLIYTCTRLETRPIILRPSRRRDHRA